MPGRVSNLKRHSQVNLLCKITMLWYPSENTKCDLNTAPGFIAQLRLICLNVAENTVTV